MILAPGQNICTQLLHAADVPPHRVIPSVKSRHPRRIWLKCIVVSRVMEYSCNPGIWEVEVRRLGIWGLGSILSSKPVWARFDSVSKTQNEDILKNFQYCVAPAYTHCLT